MSDFPADNVNFTATLGNGIDDDVSGDTRQRVKTEQSSDMIYGIPKDVHGFS